MQTAKDSFYMALRQRLAAVNAGRVVVLDGQQEPAIVMAEAQPVVAADMPSECFCVSFGAAEAARGFERAVQPLMTIECTISYFTRGTTLDGSDRGRELSKLDAELLAICTPPSTPILDYTLTPPEALGGIAFWTGPRFGANEESEGQLRRASTLKLFFVGEVNA